MSRQVHLKTDDKSRLGSPTGALVTVATAALTFFAGCGSLQPEDFIEQAGPEDGTFNPLQDPSTNPSRATSVPMSLKGSEGDGFSLVAPSSDDFIIEVTNCSSGYSTTVISTAAAPVASAALYTGDGGCVAGLRQFDWNGDTFTKVGGGTLTSGSALFDNGASNELYVSVGTPLDATITASTEAVFLVSEVKGGSDFTISGYSEGSDLSVTLLEAPEVEIPADGIKLASIHATTGVGTFDVSLQCINTLAATASACQTPSGSDQSFGNMRVKLVADTYGGTIVHSEAAAAMASGAIAVSDPDDLSTAAPITTEGFSLQLEGPGRLVPNRDMILIIEHDDPVSGAKSYRYFNVDIGLPGE